jgi:DNA-directed RNA polymerase subunit E'/Rpb7
MSNPLSGPYVDTELSVIINLESSNINQEIYKNLKKTVVNKLEGTCYKDLGYIVKIYEIKKISDIMIVNENPKCDCVLEADIDVKICKPLKNRIIVSRIENMNATLIKAISGPMDIMITMSPDRINTKIFYLDRSNNLKYGVGDKTFTVTKQNYIKVKVFRVETEHGAKNIKILGILMDIATEEEFLKSDTREFEKLKKVNLEEYLESENNIELPTEEETDESDPEDKITSED